MFPYLSKWLIKLSDLTNLTRSGVPPKPGENAEMPRAPFPAVSRDHLIPYTSSEE